MGDVWETTLLGSLPESNRLMMSGIHNNVATLRCPCDAIHFRMSTYSMCDVGMKNEQQSLVKTRAMKREHERLLKGLVEHVPDDFNFDRWLLKMFEHHSWTQVIMDMEVWPWVFSCKLRDAFVGVECMMLMNLDWASMFPAWSLKNLRRLKINLLYGNGKCEHRCLKEYEFCLSRDFANWEELFQNVMDCTRNCMPPECCSGSVM